MRRYSLQSSLIGGFAAACGLLAGASVAQAAIETWVSGTGTDAGNCPRTAPCRTFQFAHDQTNNSGAINVLTAGNFGPLTITKPISIVADGVEAVINSAPGIVVQAGANAVVSLRGLTIDMRGTDFTGIEFMSGAALHVQHCVIRRAGYGIRFTPASGTSELYVSDTVVANAHLGAGVGIAIAPTGTSSANAVLDRVRVERGAADGILFFGLNTSGQVSGIVRDSVVAGNAGIGVGAFSVLGTTNVAVVNSSFFDNDIAVQAHTAPATIRIANSTVIGNVQGLAVASGGLIVSFGNNNVNGNGTDGAPTSTIPMK